MRSKVDAYIGGRLYSELRHDDTIRFLGFNSVMRPNRFWFLCRRKPHLLAACKSVVRAISLMFTRYTRSICSACGADSVVYVNHRILWCPAFQDVRQKFWSLIWHKFGDEMYLNLASMNDELILNVLFGAFESTDIHARSNVLEDDFYCLTATYIQKLNI